MSSTLFIFYSIGISATLLISWVVYFFLRQGRRELPHWFFWACIAASGYIFLAQILKYAALNMYVDFAHWLQVLRNISIKGLPEILTHEFIFSGTTNYFSVHFVPLIYALALPFKLISRPETLIILNVLLMFSSIIPLYGLAFNIKKNKYFTLFITVLFLWYPTFQYITLYEFEMLRFSIPILLWMLYFWEKKNIGLYFLFTLLAVLAREEVGLTIAMFGVYLLWKERQRKVGITTIILGLGSFLVITQWIMPAFRSGDFVHVGAYWFSQFGDTSIGILKGIITHPLLLIKTVFNPIKLANIGMLFLPLLFLPFLAPAVLISIIASIGIGLLSGAPEHTSYMLYYISPSVPFIFYALLKAWPKITARFNARAVMSAMLAGIIISNIFFGPSPISLQFWSKNLRPAPFRTQNFHWSAYRVTDHQRKVEEFVHLIPDEAIVSAEQFLAPRLFKKKGMMVFPQLETDDGKYKAEYVFIDKTNPVKTGAVAVPGSWDGLRQNPQFYYDWVEKDFLSWELIKAEDGYFLYRRK
ncbi:MAG: DUF2079 domain-containing protein [Candidatus Nealsonbacteria bacterium]|nr:DUF2079 domain-containing protein [Candidatus Nealsonbacteria bacterium]